MRVPRPLKFLLAAIFSILIFAISFFAHTGFAGGPEKDPSQNSVSMAGVGGTESGPADIVITNARIYTVDPSHPSAAAVAIRGEWIVAVGDSAEAMKSWIGPKTRVMDLHGQFAMPGFNDAHLHLAEAAYAKLEVDLLGTNSLAEFQQRIRGRLKDYKSGEWMTGLGWDQTLWPVKNFPSRQDLDAVSTEHPMLYRRVDGHVAVANSRALALAGITRATPDPPGGRIVRDSKTGDPTGLLQEDASMNIVANHIAPYSIELRLHAFEVTMEEAVQTGVTSVQDNSVMQLADGENYGWENFRVYRRLKQDGKLKIRITEWLPFYAPLARLEEMRREGGTTDPWLKTGTLKAVLDGALGGRTAALLAPYSDDPGTAGILRVDPAELTKMAIERDRAGFQLAFHAIGDRANRVALDTFAAVLEANGTRERRDRIEHAQVVEASDFARFASLDIIASMQPSHLLQDARWATERLGPERARGAYAWHTMQRNHVRLAFGTDFPDASVINPLRGIYSCITRELPQGGPEGGWEPQEKLSMDDCIRDYTAGSAFAQFEENRKGMIMRGMLADIVVFPADIIHLPAKELLTTQVTMTIVGGRVAYQIQQAH